MEPNLHVIKPEDILENKELFSPEEVFVDRSFESVEGGERDERGFYTTPNGSFWDEEGTYFNHLGFDKNGGSYDKFGIYQPGPGYDEKNQLYLNQKYLLFEEEREVAKTKPSSQISQLKDQELQEDLMRSKYELPVEYENEDQELADEDLEKREMNLTYDDNEIKEALDDVMNIDKNEKNYLDQNFDFESENKSREEQ